MSTPRQALKELLAEQPHSSLELSQLLSLPEKRSWTIWPTWPEPRARAINSS